MPTFSEVRDYLQLNGSLQLPYSTNPNVIFTATADVCRRGPRLNVPIIRIRSGDQSNILIYKEDWGKPYTSGGTLIRHVQESLDPYIEQCLNSTENHSVSRETIYDVFWEGPFNCNDPENPMKKHHVFYQIYGHHPVYGSNVLLYIGMTEKGQQRIEQHERWMEDEYDTMTVRYGSVGEFTSWKDWEDEESGERAAPEVVKNIESLLIYANQPAYNSQNKADAKKAKNIRIFNSGKSGQLLPEVSYTYYLGD